MRGAGISEAILSSVSVRRCGELFERNVICDHLAGAMAVDRLEDRNKPVDPARQATELPRQHYRDDARQNSDAAHASGIGDVSARLKIGLGSGPKGSMALLLDGRFATGSASDLLGSGSFAGRALAVLSGRFENFSPHVNVGYLYRAGDLQTSAVLGTFGFDHLLAPWAMLGVDLISEFQVGDNKSQLPQQLTFDSPYTRTIDLTNIPNSRDDIVNGSFGFKLRTLDNLNTVANVLIPLNRGGLRPNLLWTIGAEYNF